MSSSDASGGHASGNVTAATSAIASESQIPARSTVIVTSVSASRAHNSVDQVHHFPRAQCSSGVLGHRSCGSFRCERGSKNYQDRAERQRNQEPDSKVTEGSDRADDAAADDCADVVEEVDACDHRIDLIRGSHPAGSAEADRSDHRYPEPDDEEPGDGNGGRLREDDNCHTDYADEESRSARRWSHRISRPSSPRSVVRQVPRSDTPPRKGQRSRRRRAVRP